MVFSAQISLSSDRLNRIAVVFFTVFYLGLPYVDVFIKYFSVDNEALS